MNRRNFLLNSIGGLSIPSLLQAQYGITPKAKNVIYIWLSGGISSQETWDSKSNIDSEYRGPFTSIKTKTDGLFFSEKFPLLAGNSDKFSVIRSMTHGQAAHERGTEYLFTGYQPSPALSYPSIGSVISEELGIRNDLPPYITVPTTQNEFANSGFLSGKYNPFSLGSDPAFPSFKVKDLEKSVSQRRRNLLEIADSKFVNSVNSDEVKSMSEFYSQAFRLMDSEKAKAAFQIEQESTKIKELYGKTIAGQRFLMARRLIEAGVRIVKVNFGGWDDHDNIKQSFDIQGPILDQALSGLFIDLKEKGILDETIVIVASEFGRTPKINKTNGRDHYPNVFSLIVGGGGIRNGIAYGSSDQLSTSVDESPVKPEDVFATVFQLLGIDGSKQLMTADLRPVSISRGTIIKDLI